jgi:hypothetical protein
MTAADFRLDDTTGIGALLEAVANQHHRTLREKAQQNIISVQEARYDHADVVPHLQEIVGALWLRSIAVGRLAGAEPAVLQLDITRDKPVDDNAFQVELATIVENSFNIHKEGTKLLFREEENPRAKLMAYARNDKLFADGSDQAQLAKQIRYVIGGSDEVAKTFRVIALPKSWVNDTWTSLDETEQPERWDDRLPILILPEEPEKLEPALGRWLKDQLQKRRNTVRFLLPRSGSTNAFLDRDLLILARVEMKAQEWGNQNPEYKKLHKEFETALRENLKKRFDRFAVIQRWNFADPAQCKFNVEHLDKQGAQIPEAIEEALTNDLFVPEDFEQMVLEFGANNDSVGKLLRELQEPRPSGQDCIPWLGETAMKERLLRLCAKGKIAINVRGMEFLQTHPGEDDESAWRRLRPKLSLTGRHLDDVFVMLPSAVPATGGAMPPAATPTGGGGLFGDGQTPPSPSTVHTPPVVSPTPAPGTIFDGGSATVKPRIPLSNPPTSPLNLIGKLEGWGIGPATQVAEVSIKVSSATGAQLKELLKKLPDGMTFELNLEKDDT